jgi:hypothetical protein
MSHSGSISIRGLNLKQNSHQYKKRVHQRKRLTLMILESAMYAPFFVPAAPCQAVRPPPQARLAKITFWNQLFQKLSKNSMQALYTLTPCQIQKDLAPKLATATRMIQDNMAYNQFDRILYCQRHMCVH